MTNPIPFTADPSDPNSPKGAIPVTVHGIEGGGDPIDWSFVYTPTALKFESDGGASIATGSHLTLNGDNSATLRSSMGGVTFEAGGGDLSLKERFRTITVGSIIDQLDDLTSRIEAIENASE